MYQLHRSYRDSVLPHTASECSRKATDASSTRKQVPLFESNPITNFHPGVKGKVKVE